MFNARQSQIPGPLSDEIEQAETEKKKQQRKLKRFKEKVKRKEFELKKQEENEKQRFLNLSDKEKVIGLKYLLYETFYLALVPISYFLPFVLQRALVTQNRMLSEGYTVVSRCFQCAIDMTDKVPFEYNANRSCSMPCLKEHRLHNKYVI